MTLTIKKRKERAYAEHVPKWQRFQTVLTKANNTQSANQQNGKTTLHPYQRQYAHVYHQRLVALKDRCWQAIATTCKSAAKVDRILELKEGVPSVLVGTIVKQGGEETLAGHCKVGATVFVEDESGRCNLLVDNVHDFCTGMIVGLLGSVDTGVFQVEQVFFPTMLPHPVIEKKENSALGTPHMLLISGLACGDPSVSPLYRNMILDYVRGHFDPQAGSHVAQVIIAGGSTCGHDSTVGLKELDVFCLQLCALGVGVDILPGKDDPTTANWPQRPLHTSLLKYSDRTNLLARGPNPYGAQHATKYVLGTDGTNVTDLAQSLLHENEEPLTHLQALRKTLQCGHICPTGPATVPTMPHPHRDPMVMGETPHLYFAGNCSRFETEVVEDGDDIQCRLVCIPEYAKTGTVVLVNLETLEVEDLHFEDPEH